MRDIFLASELHGGMRIEKIICTRYVPIYMLKMGASQTTNDTLMANKISPLISLRGKKNWNVKPLRHYANVHDITSRPHLFNTY